MPPALDTLDTGGSNALSRPERTPSHDAPEPPTRTKDRDAPEHRGGAQDHRGGAQASYQHPHDASDFTFGRGPRPTNETPDPDTSGSKRTDTGGPKIDAVRSRSGRSKMKQTALSTWVNSQREEVREEWIHPCSSSSKHSYNFSLGG